MFLVTGGEEAREAVLMKEVGMRDGWTVTGGSSYLLFNFLVLFLTTNEH
jgi:hypothetical protein